MDFTKIYFIGVCLFAYLFARLAERKNRKTYMIISALFLIIFSGLRSSSVGIDTETYYTYFYRIQNGLRVYINERAFVEIIRFLYVIFDNTETIIFILSAATIVLFYLVFWRLRESFSLSWMILIFICLYYARSMNIMRQYLAWAIVFYGLHYLLKQQYLKYTIAVVIAMGIHFSAIVSFAILGIYLLTDKVKKGKLKSALLILVILGSMVSANLLQTIDKFYNIYFTVHDAQIGYMSFYKIAVMLGIAILSKNHVTLVMGSDKRFSHGVIIDYKFVILYFIGVLLDSLAYFSSYTSRIGLYFLSFEMLFWGQLFKLNENVSVRVYKLLLLLMLIYIYMSNNIIGDGYGLFPYSTIFNK